MANALTTAEFFGTPVSIIDHDNRRWLTAEQAGLCLGYNPTNAGSGIRNLYNRHEDEFTEEDARRVNLSRRDGKTAEALIFSATGCNLLGFFSNTARAKDFRVWAKQFLAGHRPAGDGSTAAPAEARLDRLDANMAQLAAGMATLATGIGASLSQMAVTRKYIGLLELNQQGKRKMTAEVREEIGLLAAEGMNNADIARLLRVSRTTVSLFLAGKYLPLPAPSETPAPKPEGKPLEEIVAGFVAREEARLATALTVEG